MNEIPQNYDEVIKWTATCCLAAEHALLGEAFNKVLAEPSDEDALLRLRVVLVALAAGYGARNEQVKSAATKAMKAWNEE